MDFDWKFKDKKNNNEKVYVSVGNYAGYHSIDNFCNLNEMFLNCYYQGFDVHKFINDLVDCVSDKIGFELKLHLLDNLIDLRGRGCLKK